MSTALECAGGREQATKGSCDDPFGAGHVYPSFSTGVRLAPNQRIVPSAARADLTETLSRPIFQVEARRSGSTSRLRKAAIEHVGGGRNCCRDFQFIDDIGAQTHVKRAGVQADTRSAVG